MQVSISTDPYAVFQDAEWALMIGAKPRGPGQERADLLDQNGRIFVEQVRVVCGLCVCVLCVKGGGGQDRRRRRRVVDCQGLHVDGCCWWG